MKPSPGGGGWLSKRWLLAKKLRSVGTVRAPPGIYVKSCHLCQKRDYHGKLDFTRTAACIKRQQSSNFLT